MNERDAQTRIICHACKSQVARGSSFCTFCGALLSASQLRASTTKRMSPRELAAIVNAHLQRLAEAKVPLSIVEGEFMTEVMAWFSEASGELKRRGNV